MDYTEVQAALERQRMHDTRQRAHEELIARAQRHAAERMGRLLTLDEWGSFKALLRERILASEAALAQAREELETAVGDDREKVQLRIQRLRGALEAFSDAVTLPNQVSGVPA